ncbi:MAG TPA: XdhC family protein [Xanthomonadales bacterium]|nr:XdhC family protein [Xanthomonadales bacterium]
MLSYPADHSLRQLLDNWRRSPRPVVAALVTATTGSSYRKPGALALIDAQGLAIGCISGGCLELDLLAAAQQALHTGDCTVVRYDTRSDEDRVFGSQTGCRGEVEVLLWPDRSGSGHALFDALVDADDNHQSIWVGPSRAPSPPKLDCAPSNQSAYLRIAPPPRLLLLGAGPEAPALIGMLRTLGWHVDVIEHRARYLAGDRLQGADRVLAARPASALTGLNLDRFDAVICATHLFDEDRACLELLATSAIAFIGVLGPGMRRDELLRELPEALAARLHDRVEGPAGVMLGAHGPEAVALSIAARLTQRFGHV